MNRCLLVGICIIPLVTPVLRADDRIAVVAMIPSYDKLRADLSVWAGENEEVIAFFRFALRSLTDGLDPKTPCFIVGVVDNGELQWRGYLPIRNFSLYWKNPALKQLIGQPQITGGVFGFSQSPIGLPKFVVAQLDGWIAIAESKEALGDTTLDPATIARQYEGDHTISIAVDLSALPRSAKQEIAETYFGDDYLFVRDLVKDATQLSFKLVAEPQPQIIAEVEVTEGTVSAERLERTSRHTVDSRLNIRDLTSVATFSVSFRPEDRVTLIEEAAEDLALTHEEIDAEPDISAAAKQNLKREESLYSAYYSQQVQARSAAQYAGLWFSNTKTSASVFPVWDRRAVSKLLKRHILLWEGESEQVRLAPRKYGGFTIYEVRGIPTHTSRRLPATVKGLIALGQDHCVVAHGEAPRKSVEFIIDRLSEATKGLSKHSFWFSTEAGDEVFDSYLPVEDPQLTNALQAATDARVEGHVTCTPRSLRLHVELNNEALSLLGEYVASSLN